MSQDWKNRKNNLLIKCLQKQDKLGLSCGEKSKDYKKIRLKLLKCEKAENQNSKFKKIYTESQKVTNTNIISYYIMVAEVKK